MLLLKVEQHCNNDQTFQDNSLLDDNAAAWKPEWLLSLVIVSHILREYAVATSRDTSPHPWDCTRKYQGYFYDRHAYQEAYKDSHRPSGLLRHEPRMCLGRKESLQDITTR